jgi:DNA-binding transcriptional MerR regulator
MVYTVKQLSELSGVTIRTLHFYEEAGILEPAYYGANGYRYFAEEEFLQLQQILFFKELGFSIKQIQKVMGRNDFDKLSSLYSHKKAIKEEWEKMGKLLKTIDKTIMHLEGRKKMNEKDIFDGFVMKGKGGESWFKAEEIMLKSLKYTTDNPLEPTKKEKISNDIGTILKQIAICIDNGEKPNSKVVQQLIRKHFQNGRKLHKMSKEVYLALAQLYKEHPTFKKQLNSNHSKLAEFLSTAMVIFAENELK